MFHNEHNESPIVNGNPKAVQSDFLWGAAEIAEAINRTPRQAHYLLTKGEIQCAQKKGGRWVCPRAALLRELGAA